MLLRLPSGSFLLTAPLHDIGGFGVGFWRKSIKLVSSRGWKEIGKWKDSGGVVLRSWIWVKRAMLSSHSSGSESSGVSCSVNGHWGGASGPLCLSAGTWTSLKSNCRTPSIHLSIIAKAFMSGCPNIPLKLEASTSTIKFLTPAIKAW